MSGFEMSEWIACPPKRVFEFITDSNNAPKIVPSVKSSVKLTEGPPQVGTRYRETRLMGGKEQHAELEVSEYAEPDAIRHAKRDRWDRDGLPVQIAA